VLKFGVGARATRGGVHGSKEPFGWIKTIAGGRKLRYVGPQRNRAWFKLAAAVYNLVRITALDAAPA
jgi:hypothetical protein